MTSIIVAIDEHNAIGRKGGLLYHLPQDMQHFKALTTGHTIVMGRTTYLSFPRRPLPNRRHVVLTRDTEWHEDGILVAHTRQEAEALLNDKEENFIIGGGQIYKEWLPKADKLYVTRIHHVFEDADTFFPTLDLTHWQTVKQTEYKADEKNPYDLRFIEYTKRTI